MSRKRDASPINCIATGLLAYILTVPVHELFHMLTYLAYGDGIRCFSASAVESMNRFDYTALPAFHRIMVAGGSASILNAVIGLILAIVLLKASMGPTVRLLLTQLMGAQLAQGFGYFMIGGFFAAGDWGQVFARFPNDPGFVIALRAILSVVGSAGVVGSFFLLNHMSYFFIENPSSRKERMRVALELHLTMLILGVVLGMIVSVLSPTRASGELSLGLAALYNLMWIPFFWGFMFTGVMKVLPPKRRRFLYPLPAAPNYALLAVGAALALIDVFVLGPGIFFH